MITLYFAAVLSDTAEVNTGVLSEYRTKRLASLQSPVLRRQMISAELLLNRAVMDRLPSASLPFGIAESEKGKPFFVDLPLSFSLSHSGNAVACALADDPVGVDIQEIRKPNLPLMRRCFTPEEQKMVLSAPVPDEVFTAAWCMKESYCKATGQGLACDLSKLPVPLCEPPGLSKALNTVFWHYRLEGYQLTVCSLNPCESRPDLNTVELRMPL